VIGGFEFAVGPVLGIGFVMESAMGERTAEALVEEQKQESDVNAFRGKAVGVAVAIASEQTVALEFAQIVAELVQCVLFRGKLERRNHGLVNLFGRPAADSSAVVDENFQQPNDTHIVDFDAGIANRSDVDRQSDPLEQREVHVDIETLRLEIGEAVGDGLEVFSHRVQMIEPFLQAEVAQVVGTKFVAQETGELFVLLEEGVLPVGAKDMMAMFDLIYDGGQFAVQSLAKPDAEDLTDAMCRQPPQADFATSLEDLVNRKVPFKDEIPAVLDLCHGIETRETHVAAFLV
jgi:hypothetical protein